MLEVDEGEGDGVSLRRRLEDGGEGAEVVVVVVQVSAMLPGY